MIRSIRRVRNHYAVGMTVNGRWKKFVVDRSGKVVDLEEEVTVASLPAAVQKTVAEQSQGAALRGVSQETEKGNRRYEAETIVNGHTRDVLIHPAGKVVEVEEQVQIDSLPAAAKDQIKNAAGTGKVLRIEAVSRGDNPKVYEALIQRPGKRFEIRVAADGKLLRGEHD